MNEFCQKIPESDSVSAFCLESRAERLLHLNQILQLTIVFQIWARQIRIVHIYVYFS